MRSVEAHRDGSFNRYEHIDKYKWRGLETIITHEPVEVKIRDVTNDAAFAEDLTCEMLCLESRQAGEHGRRKYYDATEDELFEVNE